MTGSAVNELDECILAVLGRRRADVTASLELSRIWQDLQWNRHTALQELRAQLIGSAQLQNLFNTALETAFLPAAGGELADCLEALFRMLVRNRHRYRFADGQALAQLLVVRDRNHPCLTQVFQFMGGSVERRARYKLRQYATSQTTEESGESWQNWIAASPDPDLAEVSGNKEEEWD